MMSSGCPGTATGGVALCTDGPPKSREVLREALGAMNYLWMFVGERGWVQLDVNQSRSDYCPLRRAD